MARTKEKNDSRDRVDLVENAYAIPHALLTDGEDHYISDVKTPLRLKVLPVENLALVAESGPGRPRRQRSFRGGDYRIVARLYHGKQLLEEVVGKEQCFGDGKRCVLYRLASPCLASARPASPRLTSNVAHTPLHATHLSFPPNPPSSLQWCRMAQLFDDGQQSASGNEDLL